MTDSDTESFHSANEELSEEDKEVPLNSKNAVNFITDKRSSVITDDDRTEMKDHQRLTAPLSFVQQKIKAEDLESAYINEARKVLKNDGKIFTAKPVEDVADNKTVLDSFENKPIGGIITSDRLSMETENKKVEKCSYGSDTSDKKVLFHKSLGSRSEVDDEEFTRSKKLSETAEFPKWEKFETEVTEECGDGWDIWETAENLFEDDVVHSNEDNEAHDFEGKNVRCDASFKKDCNKKSFWDWSDISGVISAVGEGISNAVETSLGLPPAENLAETKLTEAYGKGNLLGSKKGDDVNSEVNALGGFLSNIGSTFVTGSLDVLETLGKVTFDKLTVPKEGSKRKHLIFEPQEEVNLSDFLKELRERQRSSDLDGKTDVKIDVTFIDLFEAYGGFVHLEGLEMLSANSYIGMRDSCSLNSLVDKVVENHIADSLKKIRSNEDFHLSLQRILTKIGLPYDGSNLIECERRCRQKSLQDCESAFEVFKLSLESIAELTAQSVQTLHKLGQLTLIAVSDVEEAPFAQFLSLIGNQIISLADTFVQKLNNFIEDKEKVDSMVTGIFLGSEDGFTYVQQSVRLLGPLISQKH